MSFIEEGNQIFWWYFDFTWEEHTNKKLAMKQNEWNTLHQKLMVCPWFTRVGQWGKHDGSFSSVKPAHSWAEAAKWADAEISWWCVNEASNVLSEFLHNHHNKEYQEWNNHIASFGSALDQLIAGPVTSAIPPEVCTTGMLEWIRSHLTSAYLECVYSPLHDVRLVRNQVDWYMEGHFPCGWFVEEESAFPERATTIVY